MVSFYTYRLRNINQDFFTSEEFKNKIKHMLIDASEEKLKEGFGRNSLMYGNNIFSGRYCKENEHEFLTMGGTQTVKSLDITDFFLFTDKSYLVIFSNKDTVSEKIARKINELVTENTTEPAQFKPKDLDKVKDLCSTLITTKHSPAKHLDKITAHGRDLKRIDFWHEFSTEPLKKFVGRILLAKENYTISLRSDGLITLYRRTIPLRTLIDVLNDIMNNIISKNFGDVYHQTKLIFKRDDKNESE